MSLRRRGQLLPLERRTNENEDDESDSQNVFAHYVSPCDFQVSNDPLGSNQGQCDTNLIGCVRDHDFLPGTREQTKEIKLEYEYDLYYQFDSKNYNFMDMLDFIEGAMLDHVASPAVLDKQQCGASGSGRRLGDDRRYLLFSDDIKKAIVAISSEPLDKQNRNYDCVTPPEEGVACQPMTGSMTIYYERARLNSETLEQLKQGALDAISAGMTTNVYAKGIVKRLAYIGDTREGVTPAPVVVSEEQKAVNSNSKGDDSILGTTEITLVSSAAFLFILIAVAGFFIIPKRRKKEALRNGSVPHGAVLDDGFDNADETTEANAVKGWYNTKIEPVPIDRQQSSYSIEGSEIPGSLAATDALALKPQFPSRAFSGRASKKTPPAKEYRYRDNISVSAALEGLETIETDVPSYKSIVRLSPIHNQNSGISPSQVSPKRSSPLNAEAILSSGYKNDDSTEESSQYSDVDQMIAEIESEIPLSKIKSPRKGGSAIETLNRIVASDSVSDTSFRDSESGTSPFHRQAAPKMRSSLDIYQ